MVFKLIMNRFVNITEKVKVKKVEFKTHQRIVLVNK